MDGKTTSQRLHLAEHVRACVVGQQVVLLDLKRNRYHGLDGRQWQAVLSALRTGGPKACASSDEGQAASTVIDVLRRRQILATSPTRPRERVPLPAAATSIDVRRAAAHSDIDLPHLIRFLFATSQAALWLRFRSLDSIVRSLEARHLRCSSDAPDRSQRLLRSIALFDRLRPLAFTSKDKCLFDSLALTLFLALQGIAVHWVVGVATRPFKAHSWVQDEAEVLNDLHESVGQFTPLLVV